MRSLAGRYPGVAVVAGASEGIGAAFARRLAADGCELLLIARRPGPLEELANELRAGGAAVATLSCDLAAADAVETVVGALDRRPVGLLVYNAASAPVGRFLETDSAALDTLIAVNVRTPTLLVRRLFRDVATARRGLVLVSSMAGWQGAPMIAGYGASKAFLRVLGEGLWDELASQGIDVVVPVPGATATPGYTSQSGRASGIGVLDPDRVARAALRSLGRRPLVVPGFLYTLSALVMTRLSPRRLAIRAMGIAGRRLVRGGE